LDIGFLGHVIALRWRGGLNGWGAIPGGAISGGTMRRRGSLPLLLSLRGITLGWRRGVARLLLAAIWRLRTVLAGGRRLLAVWCALRRRRLTVWSALWRRLAVWSALGRRLTVLRIRGILLVLVLAWLAAGWGRLVLAAGLGAHSCGLVAVVRLLVGTLTRRLARYLARRSSGRWVLLIRRACVRGPTRRRGTIALRRRGLTVIGRLRAHGAAWREIKGMLADG
jgi:hypothetical protein